ncbi:unnamed protein product [Arabidopsis halleri]
MAFSELGMYEFSSNSWRALGEVTLGCILQSRGVSFKGDTYWIALQVKEFLLVTFDFTRERFGRLNLPSSQCLGYQVLALSLVREEQFSILQQRRDTSMVEIWVTTNDKTKSCRGPSFWQWI